MKNWTTKRRIAFWTHLIYIIVPALAALLAALRLWTFIFGEWYFAVPLILCLEGVAAIGFWFHLTGVNSPFVKARHFIPFFSVATLGYELGAYLVDKHGPELGIPVTAFVVGVFGFLFIKSFGVLESLMIDPVSAAVELAEQRAEEIRLPVAVYKATGKVYRSVAEEIRAEERGQPAQPQLTVEVMRAMLEDVLASQPLLTASVAPRVAEPQAQPTYAPPQPARFSDREVERLWHEVGAEQAVTKAREDCCGQCEVGCLDCPLSTVQAPPQQLGQAVPEASVAVEDTPCQGEGCTNRLNNGQKGVATRWAKKRELGDLILCTSCRAKHSAN